jgi:hypothetical protein
MSNDTRGRKWYAACRAFPSLPDVFRDKVSRQTQATYRKIARLPKAVGQELDRRLAPLFVVRWIAWAKTRDAIVARHVAAIAHHDRTRRWPPENQLTTLDDRGEVI